MNVSLPNKIITIITNLIKQNIYTFSLYFRRFAAAIVVFCLARYLLVSEYGLYSSYVNLSSMLLLFANFGFNEYILVSSKSNVKEVRLKLSFFLLLSNMIAFIILLISNCLPLIDKHIFSLVFLKCFLDGTFFALILTYYQSTKKFNTISIINCLYSIVLIFIIMFCYHYRLNLKNFLILSIIPGIINYIYSYITAKLSFTMVVKHLKAYFKMIDKQLLYYGLVMVTVFVYFQMPSLFVSTCLDKTSAGIYFAAFNIFSILLLISGAQVQQIMPDMIKAPANNIMKIVKENIISITAINVLLLIFFIFFGKWLLLLLYSKTEYLMSYPLLIIGAFGNIFMSAGGILACFMTAKGFQRKKLKYQLECLVIVTIIIYLLRSTGIYGATVAYCLISMYVFLRYLFFTITQVRIMTRNE